jgi:hypothetical protein
MLAETPSNSTHTQLVAIANECASLSYQEIMSKVRQISGCFDRKKRTPTMCQKLLRFINKALVLTPLWSTLEARAES